MAKITTVYKGDMLSEVTIGEHTMKVDVPDSMGGKDRGPTPPQIFIVSLGTCVSALVANYCNQAGLNAEGMTVDVFFEKVEDPVRLKDIRVVINLPNMDVSKRERAIKAVAEHCPVHETICSLETVDIEVVGQ